MGVDEVGTLAALRSYRAELIDPKIAEHGGRIVKTMGDGLLLEFPSVVDATACAIEVQEAMVGRNAEVAEEQRIVFRVGVNLGDIIIEGQDILGDGVNIAARIEALAEPGGVAISGRVHDDVRDRLDARFTDTGEQILKNIARPVPVWQWIPLVAQRTPSTTPVQDKAPPLAEKPSIAVLPFVNMSGDPEQEYFVDGLTEDIITGLSRFRSLIVIARNSIFSYKGQSPNVRDVANDLGVRYVMEGSVRRGGNRIRITGQLVDAETGNHLWAERYDRDLEDIFAVQDEVTEAIVAAIAPEIDEVERDRAHRKPPDSLDAWDHYQRGLSAYYTATADSLRSAVQQFDTVNELDPSFAPAFAIGADARARLLMHHSLDEKSLLSQAREKARIGVNLDDRDPTCLWVDSRVQSLLGRDELAISRAQEAINLNPNSSMVHYIHGFVLGRAGRPHDAIVHVSHAIRISPRDMFSAAFLAYGCSMLFHAERYEEAFEWAQRASHKSNPLTESFLFAVAALVKLGRHDETAIAVADLLAHAPASSLRDIRKKMDLIFPASPEANKSFIEALDEAGLPK